jgi:hypothetical protein
MTRSRGDARFWPIASTPQGATCGAPLVGPCYRRSTRARPAQSRSSFVSADVSVPAGAAHLNNACVGQARAA